MTTAHHLSFTELDRHHWCGRATQLTREAPTSRGRSTDIPPPLQLGLLAHGVLERTLKEGPWPRVGWEPSFDSAWPQVNGGIVGARVQDWKRLPGVQLVRLTLRRWLSDATVLEAAREGFEVEEPVDDGPLLRGVPDAVVGGPDDGTVWDLKTACTGDEIDDRTRRQLELYAGLLDASGRGVAKVGVIGKATWHSEPVDVDRAGRALEAARRLAAEVLGGGVAQTNPTVDGCLDCRWLHRCRSGRDFLEPHGHEVEVLEARAYATGPHALVKGLDDGEARVVGPLAFATEPASHAVFYTVGSTTRIVTTGADSWHA